MTSPKRLGPFRRPRATTEDERKNESGSSREWAHTQASRYSRLPRASVVFGLLSLIVGTGVTTTSGVPVQTSLTLRSSPNPATVKDSLRFSGMLTTGKSPVTFKSVQIQYSKDKKQWVTITTSLTASDGRYTSDWKPSFQGQFYLRGFFAATAQYSSAISSIVTQTVKPPTNTGTPSGSTLLMTNGTQIAFANGTIVILRGVNLSGYEYIPPIQWAHHSSDYATIASWGFNVVRLPISWENLEPRAGVYDDRYLQNLVGQDIAWAKQYGIYIVLDMHQICWSSRFTFCNGSYSAGIPSWAVSGYTNNQQGMQLMIRDFFSGSGANGSPASPTNPSLLARFLAAWRHVASRYKSESTVAGYDVLNEAADYLIAHHSADSTFRSITLPSFYTNAIDAIRSVDPSHICFYGWGTDVAIQRPYVVYSPHYPGDSYDSYVGTAALITAIQQIISISRNWNVPVFVGEWGMRADAPGVAQYINDSLSLYDTYSISSALWDYASGSFTMDLFDSNGIPRQILVQNLVRPFVRQVSSPSISATTYKGLIQTFEISTTTVPLHISVSIPRAYSVGSVQANTGASVNWQFSLQTLLLALSANVSQVTVQYIPS